MDIKEKIKEIENRISDLESSSTVNTYKHGTVNLKKLARIVDGLKCKACPR